ncbi:MAG: sulfite exporter TauE/SafE family protein [Paracoccaceae bacterium]
MSTQMIIFLVAGAVSGGFINGLAGTGTALFALGFYLIVLDPIRAVAVIVVMAILVGLQGLWVVRHTVMSHPKRVLRFVIPGLIGVPIGVPLLNVIDASTLRIAVAVCLILYGAYFSVRKSLPAFSRPTPKADMLVGLTGGVLGGAAALAGVVPQLWLSLRPWSKSETRGVLQPFNMAVMCTTIVLLFLKGAYDTVTLYALMVTIPSGVLGAQIGILVFGVLSDTMFRRLLIAMTFVMGLAILLSEVF